MKLFGRVICGLFLTTQVAAGQSGAVWREDFQTLDAWRPLTFPKIEKHTLYTTQLVEGNQTVLMAEADGSASGLILRKPFNPAETPILHWRWKVENVFEKGDAARKDGDDYPLRVYVLFTYDPSRASFSMRAKYAVARALYGEYPPHASLNYIWANRNHGRRIIASPYTDRSRMVTVQSGDRHVGQWVEQEVNILEDYHAAFGEDPPREASLAVMSDADNIGESTVGFIDFIELRNGSFAERGTEE